MFTTPSTYNYAYFNLNRNRIIQQGGMPTWNEFFAVEFFGQIKYDIGYNGEGVAALGFEPSVLMYNGFSTIDGYNNSYPLAHMHAFREIIAPQLERNEGHREYFDYWGARMYLYNDDMWYGPTRMRMETPVELHINTEAFRSSGGTFIFSRAEISNADDLEIRLVNHFYCDSSIYEIFLYTVEPDNLRNAQFTAVGQNILEREVNVELVYSTNNG